MTNFIPKHKHTKISIISLLALTIALITLVSSASTVNATYVSLNKQHNPTTIFQPGNTITFTLTLNVLDAPAGSAIAIRHLNITDILPAGLTYVVGSETHTPTATFTPSGQTLFWDFGVTTVHTTTPQAVVTFQVTVDTGVTGILMNQAIAEYYENVANVYSNPGITDTVTVEAPPPTPSPTPSPTPAVTPSPPTGTPYTVGGEFVPANVMQLLTPYLMVAFLVTTALVSSVLIYKHRKRTT